eukprot:CAMPEP_0170472278 /NCGR_PEP_ID=MMETSP0123-20130129/14337_1 /TAXON_ID=182087 /ORGANISM="Favella ehrenbergii, Strain Fehren 1" /LENGTH=223 /DNA_ID=CAMNT_0010740445 /DNA_START=269 /DNA_END=940 /DNA_ORIENTATION=+
MLELLEGHLDLGLLQVVLRARAFESNRACVDLGVFGVHTRHSVLVKRAQGLVQVLKSVLIELFLADVQDEIDWTSLSDALNERLEHLLAFQVLRVNVDALLALDDVDDLQLAKHVVEVVLELFCLPVAELLVSLLIIERDRLVPHYHLCAIGFLLIALHDADDSLVPADISRLDQVDPIGLVRHLAEKAVFGDQDQVGALLTEIGIHFSARAVRNEPRGTCPG